MAIAAGSCGLAVQGAVLLVAVRSGTGPDGTLRALYAAGGAAVLVAALLGTPAARRSSRALLCAVVCAGLVTSIQSGPGRAGRGTDAPSAPSPGAAAAAFAAQRELLLTWGAATAGTLSQPAAAPGGGALFRALAAVPARWTEEAGADALPLAAGVWRHGQRAAWTSGLVPLEDGGPPEATGPGTAEPEPGLCRHRGGWCLRAFVAVPGGHWLELQLALPQPGRAWLGTVAEVGYRTPAAAAGSGMVEGDLALRDPAQPDLEARFRPAVEVAAAGPAQRARHLAVLAALWPAALAALAAVARRPGGGALLLAALWIGRAFLAAVDLRQLVVASFPGIEYPTAPSAWASLIDPAYFATPIAAGWFACTADALLTSLLLAATAAWGVRRGRRRADAPAHAGGSGRGHALAAGALAGVLAGLALPAWRALAMLVAENANARLVGPGVSMSSLTFWGLHVCLLLVAMASLALVVGATNLARRAGSGRAWVPAVALLATAAAALALLRRSPAEAALTLAVLGLVWGGGAVADRREGPRRLAWAALLLLGVVWNHDALRQVQERAGRAWIEQRLRALTETDAGWMRYLVQSALVEMQAADHAAGAVAAGLWRDEPAWRLYDGSALADLGYPCLVEILDATERSTSLFAAGFLRDFRYETLERTAWVDADGQPAGPGAAIAFQSEVRLYGGGQEEILVAEAPRRSGRGWLRLEAPLRSWRIGAVSPAAGDGASGLDRYRPRQEVDRPVLMLLADDRGWLASGAEGFPGPENDAVVAQLRAGARDWGELRVGGASWLCRWMARAPTAARTPGEGFVVGIRQSTPAERLLDVSRLLLANAAMVAAAAILVQAVGWRHRRRLPSFGFQEKFLAGYLALGLLLLLVVGLSVERVATSRVRQEARTRAREGLTMALQQLGGVLADEARALADSGQLDAVVAGEAPLAGSDADLRDVVLFRDDGTVVHDGSDVPLDAAGAAALLAAARAAPLVLAADGAGLQAMVAVPVALGGGAGPAPSPAPAGPGAVMDSGDWGFDGAGRFAEADAEGTGPAARVEAFGHGGVINDGVLLVRRQLDGALLAGLADILGGEVTLSVDGEPVLASHPEGLFEGARPPLLDPALMATLFDHPHGAGFVTPPGRPFACDAAQPLPAFGTGSSGYLERRLVPAVLGVSFPGREREFAAQRRANVLFLAGLANLILLTALLLAVLMSWSLFRPLRVLMGATQSLAGGDYGAPLPPAGSDEVGSLAQAFGAMRARLQATQADLAARERFLATVLERVTVGVAVVSARDELVVANPAGRAILARCWAGQPTAAAALQLRDGLLAAARALGSPATAGGTAAELALDGGRLTLRGAVAPLDGVGVGGDLMLVFEDVSEFLATKKLALNAELARQVAHEIKNPLTPIQLSVQLLGQAWQDRHPQLERIVPDTVSRVLEQVDLLRRIASEFSLLGRPDELPRSAVDLAAVVARVAEAYRPAAGGAGRGLVPDVSAPAGLPRVLAHEESLLKILGNLAQNSLDAARPGLAAEVDLAWEAEAGRVRLRWRDNGTGIPQDVAARLFEPYFSTKSKGTGLGLAICRSLAERMGGSLALADRADGPGAEAVLELAAATNEGS